MQLLLWHVALVLVLHDLLSCFPTILPTTSKRGQYLHIFLRVTGESRLTCLTAAETNKSLRFFGRRLSKITFDSYKTFVEGVANKSQLSVMTPLKSRLVG